MKGRTLILDYGTTSLKAVLYNEDYSTAAQASLEWRYTYPQNGWMELDPRSYIDDAILLTRGLLDRVGGGVDTISVTGQAETLICVGADGAPVGNAIIWLDTRAQAESNELLGRIGTDALYRSTGLTGFDPILPLAKLLWLRRNQPELYSRTWKLMLLHDYVLYALTGQAVSEYSVNSCTGYFHIVNKEWDAALLDAAQIDSAKLPEPAEASLVVGGLLPEISARLGITGTVRVVNGMLDQCASAIGCGNILPGIVSETTGTVLAIAATLPSFCPDNGTLPVLCHGLAGRYLALPNCPTAGMALKWFKDNFLPELSEKLAAQGMGVYAYIDRELAARGTGENELVFLPHLCGCLCPSSNPAASGVLYGLRLGTDRLDVACAIMEGVGFLLRENLEYLQKNGIAVRQVLALGGGAKSPLWLQMKADITGAPFYTIENEESTSLGCALGAGLALGRITESDISSFVSKNREYMPDLGRSSYYDRKYALYGNLNRQLGFIPV